jgi:hypothetical protein
METHGVTGLSDDEDELLVKGVWRPGSSLPLGKASA